MMSVGRFVTSCAFKTQKSKRRFLYGAQILLISPHLSLWLEFLIQYCLEGVLKVGNSSFAKSFEIRSSSIKAADFYSTRFGGQVDIGILSLVGESTFMYCIFERQLKLIDNSIPNDEYS